MAKCSMKTEVYSRVCGYHRPVSNWNQGKKEEFKDRKSFEPVDRVKVKVA
jgi:ribonucleoside-triphosphate reductase